MDLENEIWKDIEGYEGKYRVSNLGRVKKFYKDKRSKRELILKLFMSTTGYYKVSPSKNGISKNFKLHRLIAMAFIPNPENKKTINHKNGIKTDNRIENLEWATHGDNHRHAYRTGLKKPYLLGLGKLGKDSPVSKTIIQFDKNMNPIAEYGSSLEIERITNINASNIRKACSGRNNGLYLDYIWKHKQNSLCPL